MSEPRKLAIVDRDGTIIDVVRDEETGAITTAFHPNQIRFLKGAIEGLHALQAQGFTLAIATNQPGPAKGHFSRDAVTRTNDALITKLAAENIVVAQFAVCMHHPERSSDGDASLQGPCACRKPSPGMLFDLMRALSMSPAVTWMIGDSQADVDAARAAYVRSALVFPKNRCELCPLRDGQHGATPDLVGATLVELAQSIAAQPIHCSADDVSGQALVTMRALGSLARKPWIPVALILALGVLVNLPSIGAPFVADDYVHRAMVHGMFPSHRNVFSLYDFVGDADRNVLLARGVIPWWSAPNLTIRFLRPLSSVLLWSDHLLFGEHAVFFRLHALLWWAISVLGAHALFRRSFSQRAAIIGTAVYALAPCHSIEIGWISNREVLVSLAFGIPALNLYARWRTMRLMKDAAIAAALFGLAALAGEYAFCLLGYVVAIECVTRREALARRALGVAPFVVPLSIYGTVRVMMHYGTVGAGFYHDPIAEPRAYLRAAPLRFATLVSDAWGSEESSTNGLPRWLLITLALFAMFIAATTLRRVVRSLDTPARSSAIWLFLGSFLALVPVLSAAPSVRLVGVSMLGIAGIVGVILDHAWFPEGSHQQGRARGDEWIGTVALLLGFSQLVHAPMTSWLVARALAAGSRDFARRSGEVHDRVSGPGIEDVIVLRIASSTTSLQGPFALDVGTSRPPAHWRVLSWTAHALVTRIDAHTLELRAAKNRSLFPDGEDDLFRSPNSRLRIGKKIEVDGLHVEVLDVGEAGVTHARFTFDHELEEPSQVWVYETLTGFHTVAPPATGFGMTIDL